MIILLLTVFLIYMILLKRDSYYLAYSLILIFAIKSLPSEVAEYFVLHVGDNMVKPQDVFLLIAIAYLAVSKNARIYMRANWRVTSIVLLIVVLNLLQLLYAWSAYGMESHFMRTELFGVLCLILCLMNFDLLQNAVAIRRFGIVLNIFNVLTLVTAILIINYPGLNQMDSDLYSAIGWQVLSGTGSMVYITVIAADVCLMSIYYFLFIQHRNIASITVILPIVLVMMSSHRITYLAGILLVIIYFLRKTKPGSHTKYPMRSILALSASAIVSLFLIGLIGYDYLAHELYSFFERLLSLGDSENATILGRGVQYIYFYTDYIYNTSFTNLLLGENYLPGSLRDPFYYYVVNPHNFVIGLIVAKGMVGFSLVMILILLVLVNSWPLRDNLFFVPLALYMLTQLTDAAFSNFPFSALFALLLSLLLSNMSRSSIDSRDISG